MRLSYLTGMGFYVNGAIESRKYDTITIKQIKEHIRNNTIFPFLEKELVDDLDISLWSIADRNEINDEWINFADTIDESRKLCVGKNGLSLIMAYILESIQRRMIDK